MTFGALQYFADPVEADGMPGRAWRITAAPDVMIRLKRIFPRVQTHRAAWVTLAHTPEVACDLQWVLERWPLEISDQDRAVLDAGAGEYRERQEVTRRILEGGRPKLELANEPAREPRDYQRVAADLALTNRHLLLADELGLGKTMSALLTLRDASSIACLVVCPPHLQVQWQEELTLTFPWLRAHIVRTSKPYDPARRRELRGYDPDVLIISYPKLSGWRDHLHGRVRSVIFEEAHELRNTDSQKYRAAAGIADSVREIGGLVMGVTATPVFNYADEIHHVLSVLAPDALGDKGEFAREWGGGYTSRGKLKVDDPRALGTYLREQGLFLRRTKKDVGRELPDLTRVPHHVDSDEKTHDRLMEGAVDLAEVILGQDRKAAFKASGELDWKLRHATGVAKAPYVAEFVRMVLEAERKVVLFGWHRDVYDIWLERLADFHPVLFSGSESPAQKAAGKKRFVALHDRWGDAHSPAEVEAADNPYFREEVLAEPGPDESRVLIMSLRSGAGLDGLQHVARVCVFGELDWSPAQHDQCIGRVHRDGQDDPCTAYFLLSSVGSDPIVAEVLNIKRSQSEPIRDPDADPFEPVQDTSGHVRKLAETVIAKRARREEVAA